MNDMKKSANDKVECLNANSGRTLKIDKGIYDVISKAIYHTLKKSPGITFSALTEGVHDCFKKQKTVFEGTVEWYTITVLRDMEARGNVLSEKVKGRKLLKLKQSR